MSDPKKVSWLARLWDHLSGHSRRPRYSSLELWGLLWKSHRLSAAVSRDANAIIARSEEAMRSWAECRRKLATKRPDLYDKDGYLRVTAPDTKTGIPRTSRIRAQRKKSGSRSV